MSEETPPTPTTEEERLAADLGDEGEVPDQVTKFDA